MRFRDPTRMHPGLSPSSAARAISPSSTLSTATFVRAASITRTGLPPRCCVAPCRALLRNQSTATRRCDLPAPKTPWTSRAGGEGEANGNDGNDVNGFGICVHAALWSSSVVNQAATRRSTVACSSLSRNLSSVE